MKKRKIVGKLNLNKETITALTNEGMKQVQGGLDDGSRKCLSIYTECDSDTCGSTWYSPIASFTCADSCIACDDLTTWTD